MYKLIASDVDGTIMPSNEVSTMRMKQAVNNVNKASTVLSLSTGRRIASTEVVATTLGISKNPMICHCGAAITLPSQKKILRAVHIPANIALKITEIALRSGSGISILENVHEGRHIFQLPYSHYFRTVAYNSWYGSFCRPCEISDLKSLSDPIQISLQGNSECVLEAYGNIQAIFQDALVYVDYGMLSSGDYVLDIFAANVSKAQALLVLMDMYDVKSDEVAVFGDGKNDLEILSIAGLPIAMENAPNFVKEKCARIAPKNNKDGVACVLEELYERNLLAPPDVLPSFA